jgi:hypothetical protein
VLSVEAAKTKADFIYIPTYEIITGVSQIFLNERIWGEDGTTRHPKTHLINSICEAFVKLF